MIRILSVLIVGAFSLMLLCSCVDDSPSGSSSYPWEDDKNTPDLSGGLSSSQDSSGSVSAFEGTTGEKGDTWELPEYTPHEMPWTDEDLNIPSMPGND